MTKSDLNRLLAKWQPRLRLEDWAITVRPATTEERKDEECDWLGIIHSHLPDKSAEIVIIDPRYLKELDLPVHHLEITLVHELLHLHVAWLKTKTGSLQEIAEENLVHILSTLLVALEYRDESILGVKRLSRPASIKVKKRKARAS